MKLRIFAVIDTNIFISSMLSQKGSTFHILELINQGNIIPIFDERILKGGFR